MVNLLKIGFTRLYKNFYFIGGCVLAFAITYWFIDTQPIVQLVKYGPNTSAIIVSVAIVFFFSIFSGLFFGSEWGDGTIRNKVMAGHSKMSIYLSQYITLVVSMAIMMIFWFVGALVAGAEVNKEFLLYAGIAFLYNSAYIAVVQWIVFRSKKLVNAIVIPLGIAYLLLNIMLVGNLINTITYDNPVANGIVNIVYNLNAIGQCFARSGLGDMNLVNTGIQVADSIAIIALATLFGTMGIEKKDIN